MGDGIRLYRFRCRECLRVWFSTARDCVCVFCGAKCVVLTSEGN